MLGVILKVQVEIEFLPGGNFRRTRDMALMMSVNSRLITDVPKVNT